MTQRLVLLSFTALLLGVAVALFLPRPTAPDIGGFILQPPKPLPEFVLTGDDGQPFTPDSLRGQWQFLFFGYTFCPDICPMALLEFSKVQKALAEQGVTNVGFRFISVDPARDTPARLHEFVGYFNPTFAAATGDRAEIDRLAQSVGAVYRINEPEPGKSYYLVDHSATVMILNPEGQLAAVMSPPHDPPTVTKDFMALRRFYEASQGFFAQGR